jgi:hypothetical protein
MAGVHDMVADDLPPCYVNFDTGEFRFAFNYREPHLLPNTKPDYAEVNLTHNIDRDWALWGHNFRQIFDGKIPDASKAMVNGKRTEDQFCFSSEETYQAMRAFVEENHGKNDGKGKFFMISPNDNDLVCTCELCRKHGNTDRDASPALTAFLNRLSLTFVNDRFFMTAYRTSRSAKVARLEANVGVFLSTMDLPKNCLLDSSSQDVKKFSREVEAWNALTSNVYLWDYISNFDDYLTPYPVLERVKSQTAYFRKLGISGIFMNGSGYDYAPFDDVKTYVIGALLMNPDLSIEHLVKVYFHKFYPLSGTILSSFFLETERNACRENFDAGIYSSFRKASRTYFDTDRFMEFYAELSALFPKLKTEERDRVKKLLTALSYTRLQVNYHAVGTSVMINGGKSGESNDVVDALSTLQNFIHYDDLVRYKEENGSLETYINEWMNLVKTPVIANRIKEVKVTGLASKERLDDSSLLHDGINGFSSDFNQGWFLAGEDIRVDCKLEDNPQNKGRLKLRFLINEKHRMLTPEKVELVHNGAVMALMKQNDMVRQGNTVSLDLPLSNHSINTNTVQLRVFKDIKIKNSVIACDEIFIQ